MAANIKKVKDVLLRSNTMDVYNNSSANQRGSYKKSTPKLFDCYNNLSSNHNASFNKNTSPSNYDVTFNTPFSKKHESYDNVSTSLLRKSYSTSTDSQSFNLTQHADKSDSDTLCDISAPILPSPDISHLTGDELEVLKRVFKREEMFERDEAKRLMEMERRLETYERAVRQQATGKGKLKYIDLSLCRLCHETKFADGICGRVCHDCRRRVCVRCGSSDAPHWNPRKQKNVRGKWRCNICQLKLEFVCQSGKWFHGNRSVSMVNQIIRNKIQFQDVDTSDTDNQTSVDSSSCFSASEPCSDLWKLSKAFAMSGSGSKNLQNRNRRRSGSLLLRSSPSDNDSETDDSAERARTHAKQKRAQRRNSSRRKSLKQRQLFTDVPDQDNIYNGDLTSGYVVNGGNISPCGHVHSMQRLNVASDLNATARRHSDESVHSRSVSGYFKPDDPQTDIPPQRHMKGSITQSNPNNCYFTPLQAGIPRDSWNYSVQRSQSPPLIGSSHRMSIPGLRSRSPCNTLTVDGRKSPSERRRHSHNISKSSVLGFKSDRKRFSVDQQSSGHKVKQTYLMPPESPGTRCRRWSSDSWSSRRSSGNNETAESTDCNEDTKGQEYLASLKTRDVLLYRDKNDQNCRCNGLGMRVVGGQCRYGKRLGAFVTYVDTDGPADSYGIVEGDQVLMWNGKSLVDTTFEETKRIVNQTSEIVQLVVVHHEENYGMLEVTETADDTEQEGNPSIVQPIPFPPSRLTLNKPKRRMLPKTPIEMKKDERLVSGKLQMSVAYSEDEECLSVTLVQADDLRWPGHLEISVINPIALVHLLPGRGFYPPYETIPQFNTSSPRWNETFNILEISANEVNDKSVEITLWDRKRSEDMFLGEVLLDLVDANTKDEIITYDLEDHDENSSPLPRRRRRESGSDATTNSQISPMTTTIDTSSNWSTSPSRLSIQNLNTEGRQLNEDRNSWSSPSRNRHSRHSKEEDTVLLSRNFKRLPRSGSFSSKIKQKLVVAVSRMSSTFASSERRLSLQEEKVTPNLSLSADAMLGYIVPPKAMSPRHSTDQYKGQLLDLTNSGRSHTCSETGASIYEDNSDLDEMSKRFGSSSPDGDDITSMLGPAQVPPKPASEQSVCGDIRLGLMVTQGKLEIDIICVTGLLRKSENSPPDTYVKTYLVEGSKVIQKKKTPTSKASYEPSFDRKIKYSACNIHGRHIKVKIWARQGAFDKKLCLGETVIKLDGLDLGQHSHTLSWYKLFPQGATDFSSNESLSF
ncbi:regulating synaptic membrane exocytosis protein 2-like [Pecten maximus]|uniref:regulating synaptic membrane exocytosis protein 2-like n=1 Tax=Pecten maximus TaxID=6579 RepID=UPI0014587200|nr:regulating synaptic membrane exocytosis protein 2-like [Pecten maximus]